MLQNQPIYICTNWLCFITSCPVELGKFSILKAEESSWESSFYLTCIELTKISTEFPHFGARIERTENPTPHMMTYHSREQQRIPTNGSMDNWLNTGFLLGCPWCMVRCPISLAKQSSKFYLNLEILQETSSSRKYRWAFRFSYNNDP